MDKRLLFCSGSISLAVIAFATTSFSQAAPNAPPNPSSTALRIIYTGKLLGYFRLPSRQSSTDYRCPDPRSTSSVPSEAASAFLQKRRQDESAILVGTGDNFAPQLEARVFDPPPPPATARTYGRGNKELFNWDGESKRWVPYENLGGDLKRLLAEGRGTIPNDNVGCFLAAAKYAAVVPGKHDFYFGAERVRQLARFMATIDQKLQPGFWPVQMLGANLVIKTTQVDPPPSSKPKSKWPDESTVLDLRESKAVYPWFSTIIRLKVPGPELKEVQDTLKRWFEDTPSPTRAQVERFLSERVDATTGDLKDEWTKLRDAVKHFAKVSVCMANGFNEITFDSCEQGRKAVEQKIKGDEKGIVYSIKIPRDPTLPVGRNGHYLTFEPGQSYGLCEREEKPKDNIEKDCLTFPVFRPFFNFPREVPLIGTSFSDPDPFVLIRNDSDRKPDVAIFGVVDPSISEEVGLLNFSWVNRNEKQKSVVGAEDPGEALKQQFDYFQDWYEDRYGGSFSGISVLLAQMSPQRAKVLATRFPKFQIVVAEADEEQGTSETILRTVREAGKPAGTFVAVPLPYYDSKSKDQKLEGTVHLGMIEATLDGRSWNLENVPLEQLPVKEMKSDAGNFWKKVDESLRPCLTQDFSLKSDNQTDHLKWLTLCAIRERLGADVALLQKRDFFDGTNQTGMAPDDYQQVLDRLIWKGDLLTLMYVPGSALKKALDLSKKFDSEDLSPLLANDRRRGLEILGIKKVGNDYFINEALLEEKKIYAVATSDFIGAGDTGYPDLAAASLDPRNRPSDFPRGLEPISGVVCRKLYAAEYKQNCLYEIRRETYLDEIIVQASPPARPLGFGGRLWKIFPFKVSGKTKDPNTSADALQERVQQRSIWMFSLKNLSLGFNGLSNNLSDADIAKRFGGVSTSGVTAKKSQTITTGLDLRLSRSTHDGELFFSTGIDFKRQSVGDVAPRISQVNNRVTAEAGYIVSLLGGRSPRRLGSSFSLYTETQLQRPFTNFTLGTGALLKITQDRSLMLLPRVGLRWLNGTHSFEGGLQAGREIRSLVGYRFVTQGVTVECLPSVTETFSDCIKNLSKAPNPQISTDSDSTAILRSRPRAGFYWKLNLSIAFNKKVKYELTQNADFFFNFSNDNVTDTRYRDQSKHSLKFAVLPNFSVGPSLKLLLYKNKVSQTFLFQKEFGFETSFTFDLFNRREKGVQIRHKP